MAHGIGGFGWLLLLPLVNLFWPFADPSHRSLHDIGAKTLVVTA